MSSSPTKVARKLSRGSGSKHHSRTDSWSSDDSSPSRNHGQPKGDLPPPVLVYHASARSIVFRDQLRRAASRQSSRVSSNEDTETSSSKKAEPGSRLSTTLATDESDHVDQIGTLVNIATEMLDPRDTVVPSVAGINPDTVAGYVAKTQPLEPLELGPGDDFKPLLEQNVETDQKNWTCAEKEVFQMLAEQRAVVKTIKNDDWTAFLHRFLHPQKNQAGINYAHADKAPAASHPFNSFVTSTSLLPNYGKKMRSYGSTTSYTVGVVFGLPIFETPEEEDERQEKTLTWAWPAGYSAKTEFNRNSRGLLINGRQEALRPLSVMREYNNEYLESEVYMVGLRRTSGLTTIPYNEVFMRVGGVGRVVLGKDVTTGEEMARSYEDGIGLPVALFVRTAHFGHLVTLLRTRARLMHVWGEDHVRNIPLLYITPEDGVKVLTEPFQKSLWKIASRSLNPFQNSTIAHLTTVSKTDEASFQQKVEELLDLDESIREILTPEELARLAGGFGATDESVAKILKQVMLCDKESEGSHKLQDVVNEGLAAAVRSGDYHTSRQLLILYSLVASTQNEADENDENEQSDGDAKSEHKTEAGSKPKVVTRVSSLGRDAESMKHELELLSKGNGQLSAALPPPPPPPPLDTDRLRSATNSDGLLAVLGAAQVLKAMQDGSAQKRAFEAVSAMEEWITYGEQSMAFRISSWYDQKAAQGDLKIASENPSNFMAFVSNKAITNRRNFAEQLKEAVKNTDFSSYRFLQAIDEMLSKMHSPCLRLELLQYILGLDNRFSVAHVTRSVELAATCLGISQGR